MKIQKDTKEFVQFIGSLIVLIAGIVLVFTGLHMPPRGNIDPSVLTAFGMFLGFVGAVWNIDIKYAYKIHELEAKLRSERNEEQSE